MGFKRNLNYQFQRLFLRKKYMLADELPQGMLFRFRTPDDVGRHIFKYQTYEPHILAFLVRQPLLSGGDLVFDIGANLGWYSVLISKLSEGASRIYAFEPDPTNRALLEQNLILNSVGNVSVQDLALSDREGSASLNRYRSINLGKHSLLDLKGAVDSVSASLTTLDAFVMSQALTGRDIRVVKVDVEGHEPSVIRGAVETLPHVQNLILEYSPMYYKDEDAEEMLDTLGATGLRPLLYIDHRWSRVEPGSMLELEHQVDSIWTRDSNFSA